MSVKRCLIHTRISGKIRMVELRQHVILRFKQKRNQLEEADHEL